VTGPAACIAKDDPSAPFVAYQRIPEPETAATGGPIAAGTYFLTALAYHGGKQVATPCTMSQVHEVLRFTTTSDTEGLMHSTLVFMYADGSGRSVHPLVATYDKQP
jgi:hypothetical protein